MKHAITALMCVMLVGCGNARMPKDTIDDVLAQYRAQLQALVGQTRATVLQQLGTPKSAAIDPVSLQEILSYELTDADAQLLLNARAELESYLVQRR